MTTFKKNLPVFTVIVFWSLIFLAGCRQQKEIETELLPEAGEVKQTRFGDAVAPAALTADTIPADNWLQFSVNRFDFKYPAGWQVELLGNDSGGGKFIRYSIRVKDTEKFIAQGGAAPADYFTGESGSVEVNSEKYATEFNLISVDVYQTTVSDWNQFFEEIYSGIVTEHEKLVIPVRKELNAIQAKRVSGIYYGEPRIFVQGSGFIYDIAFFPAGRNQEELKRVFNTFLRWFRF
ncbi:hypothetical protein KKC32_04065 [Patescibacteria group bacterium]|nr:hypothetical protein [Patescibacteria group bacterium]